MNIRILQMNGNVVTFDDIVNAYNSDDCLIVIENAVTIHVYPLIHIEKYTIENKTL